MKSQKDSEMREGNNSARSDIFNLVDISSARVSKFQAGQKLSLDVHDLFSLF